MAILEFWTWSVPDIDELSFFYALWVVDGRFQDGSSLQTGLDHFGQRPQALLCRIAQPVPSCSSAC